MIVKHWSASKCWTKIECCSCKLSKEPSSPDSNSLDKNSATFKVDLNIQDTDINSISDKNNISDINVNKNNISDINNNINNKNDTCLENISHV